MPFAGWSWCRSRFLPAMGKTPPKEKRAMKVAKKGTSMKAVNAMKAMKAPKAKAMKAPAKSPKSGVKAMKVPKKTKSKKEKDADADADDDNTITTPPAEPDSQPRGQAKDLQAPSCQNEPIASTIAQITPWQNDGIFVRTVRIRIRWRVFVRQILVRIRLWFGKRRVSEVSICS